MISVPIDRLKTIPKVVAVAIGAEKVTAIKGALTGGHANVDTTTAQAISAAD